MQSQAYGGAGVTRLHPHLLQRMVASYPFAISGQWTVHA